MLNKLLDDLSSVTNPLLSYALGDGSGVWELTTHIFTPVILSVPHDGFINWRDLKGFGLEGEKALNDTHAWRVAQEIALRIPVSAVRGCFHRRFVDYNRPVPDNLPGDLLASYKLYHRLIWSCVRSRTETHGSQNCLLLDIHGYKASGGVRAPFDKHEIIMGTLYRQSCPNQVDQRLAGFLIENGYEVFLPGENPVDGDKDPKCGGHTVRHYHELFPEVDIIQLELSERFRDPEDKNQDRANLARAIAEFLAGEFPALAQYAPAPTN